MAGVARTRRAVRHGWEVAYIRQCGRPKMRSRISAGGGPKGISVAAREKADPPRPSFPSGPLRPESSIGSNAESLHGKEGGPCTSGSAYVCRYG